MTKDDEADIRAVLAALEAEIEAEDALGAAGQKTVELDQQSIGRLSRQDALQQQAMAKATQARRNTLRQRISAARARLDEGEYGYCVECGGEIAPKRLALDPTLATCVSCARG